MAVALIVAAGSGERLGAEVPKALVEVAGKELFRWSVDALRTTRGVDRIAVAMPAAFDEATHDFALMVKATPPTIATRGGATRSESVRQALAAVGPGDPVLVHDAARPLLTARLAESVIAALQQNPTADAAIAAARVTNTVKRAGADRVVHETLDRAELWSIQTPQVFRRAALERALEVPAEVLQRATDDAWLIERQGGRVVVVANDELNLKVTTPIDLRLAEMVLADRERRS